MTNAIQVIHPYKWEGLWVFDDPQTELSREPFIEGADAIIDQVVAGKGINNPEDGFCLIFSSGEFPRYDLKLEWVREGEGGNWYQAKEFNMEGWLCPALLKYFDQAPKTIYARFEKKSD